MVASTGRYRAPKSIMTSHSHALQPVFGWELLTSGALQNNAHGQVYSRTTLVQSPWKEHGLRVWQWQQTRNQPLSKPQHSQVLTFIASLAKWHNLPINRWCNPTLLIVWFTQVYSESHESGINNVRTGHLKSIMEQHATFLVGIRHLYSLYPLNLQVSASISQECP